MSLIVKKGGNYTPPPEGLWRAVCVDVVDLGMVKSEWGEKHKCRIVWELEKEMGDGKRYTASKQYGLSLHHKSTLYKDLKSWRGREFTQEELDGFDLEKVIGAPCNLLIQHDEKDGSVYGNVTAITKATAGSALKPSGSYIRKKDRKEDKPAPATQESEEWPDNEPVEDPVPF